MSEVTSKEKVSADQSPWLLVPDKDIQQLVFSYEMVLTEIRTHARGSRRGSALKEWVERLDNARDEFVQRMTERPAPEPRTLPEVAGDSLPTTLAQFEHRAKFYLGEEQAKPNPDNALIALLCDAVRLARENERMGKAGIALAPAAEPRAVLSVQLKKVRAVLDNALGHGYRHTIAGLIEELEADAHYTRPSQPPGVVFATAEHCACAIKEGQRRPDWATVCNRYEEDSTWPKHCKHCEHESACHAAPARFVSPSSPTALVDALVAAAARRAAYPVHNQNLYDAECAARAAVLAAIRPSPTK